MNINKVIVVGRMTNDPELRATTNGGQVASFTVATNRVYTQKDGQQQEDAEFHNIVVFGKQAETSSRYLKKGQIVGIEGRIQTRSWEKDGVKKYRTEIIAESVQFGPGGGQSQSRGSEGVDPEPHQEKTIEYPKDDINPEDIPF